MKVSATLPLIKICQMTPLSARSISLDSHLNIYKKNNPCRKKVVNLEMNLWTNECVKLRGKEILTLKLLLSTLFCEGKWKRVKCFYCTEEHSFTILFLLSIFFPSTILRECHDSKFWVRRIHYTYRPNFGTLLGQMFEEFSSLLFTITYNTDFETGNCNY
jgi:hypothetical protein